MASSSPLFLALLRPPVLQILRAAGFTTARPSTIDTLVDITSRYFILLATRSAVHARAHTGAFLYPAPPTDDLETLLNPDATISDDKDLATLEDTCWSSLEAPVITIPDIRHALLDAGALHPQLSAFEEAAQGAEDLRGVENFIAWCKGPTNAEARRVAGLSPSPSTAVVATTGKGHQEPATDGERAEDFLTQLKKKHAKSGTGEESRFAGTILGKEPEEQEVIIEGWQGIGKVEAWGQMMQEKGIQRMNLRGSVAEELGMDVDDKSASSDSSLSEHASLDSDI